MAAYLTVSSLTCAPDMSALQAALRAIVPDAVVHAKGLDAQEPTRTLWRIKSGSRAEGAGFTVAERVAFQAAIDTAAPWSPKCEAREAVASWPLAMRALLLVIADQINALRADHGRAPLAPSQWMTLIRAQVEAMEADARGRP